MKKIAVAGDPAAHSRSPEIFYQMFKKTGSDAHYSRLGADSVEDIFRITEKYGISGINITSPFKERIIEYLKDTDRISKQTGSVNTLIARNGHYYGFNTDVFGVAHSLVDNGIEVKNRKCVVIGGGGAARSAVYSLKDLGGEVFISNRTDEKALKISREMECGFIGFSSLKDNLKDSFLTVIAVPEFTLDIGDSLENTFVLDAGYSKTNQEYKCKRYVNGLYWLSGQAVKSFGIFFDKKFELRDFNILSAAEKKKNIAFIGMTGAGKSLFGRKTAEHYRMRFTDTDEEIIIRTGMEITDIFRSQGEEFFRKIEEEVISDAVEIENSVISIGAGALKSGLNRKNLSENCFCVLLDADTEDICSGLTDEEVSVRPMLKSTEIKAELDRMFSERRDDYFAVSDIIIRTRRKTVGDDLKKIIRELDVR
jgi:shikimate dehydrogenase